MCIRDRLQPIQQRIHFLWREFFVVMAVDYDHRRAAASGHAFFFVLQVHAAIGRGLAQFATQFLFGMRQ